MQLEADRVQRKYRLVLATIRGRYVESDLYPLAL